MVQSDVEENPSFEETDAIPYDSPTFYDTHETFSQEEMEQDGREDNSFAFDDMDINPYESMDDSFEMDSGIPYEEMILVEDPPPFEKIYVCPPEILSDPYGTYYKSSSGEYVPVRAVLRDDGGLYVIKITQKCSQCGRLYNSRYPPEGYCCPLWQIESAPNIWYTP